MITQESLSEMCVKCGMCCDGTLFNRAKIKDVEDEHLAQRLGLDVFSHTDGKSYFRQPCPLFTGCCSVYQTKPHVCNTFYCEPLKKAQKGEMSFEKAEKLINITLQLRHEITEIAAQIEAFKGYTIQQLFRELDPVPSETMKKHGQLLIKTIAIKAALVSFAKKKVENNIL